MKPIVHLIALTASLAFIAAFAAAQADEHQADAKHAGHNLVRPDALEWKTGPESLPPGAQFAILEGDPSKEGPFTMRVKFPANYKIPPHTHPRTERVTVLEGEFQLGMGREYDERAMERLPVGGFFTMPPGMVHFARTERPTTVQLNGVGPWSINYINPADDPRQRSQ
jgi:quercetin dioxygenase-like cupin family protein